MMFDAISRNVTGRLSEVHRLLAHIESLEEAAKKDKDLVGIVTTLKGLFFVNLYGAFEYSVTQSVQLLLQEISKIKLPYEEFKQLLYSVALDPSFRSVAQVGPDKRWAKRKQLLKLQVSSECCELSDTIFHEYLQNIWYETLEDVFDCLCVSGAPVPDRSIAGYIDEVVEKRNKVAHGDSSPQEVGRLTTSSDLKKTLEAISSTVNFIITSFESHLNSRSFVSDTYRHKYVAASDA